jgi:hypothetical protein
MFEVAPRGGAAQAIKVFCFFSSEKKAFLFYLRSGRFLYV